jgi:hypothetical protein
MCCLATQPPPPPPGPGTPLSPPVWDPKLTTLPGLQWSGVVLAHVVALLRGVPVGASLCTPALLRCVNWAYTVAVVPLALHVARALHAPRLHTSGEASQRKGSGGSDGADALVGTLVAVSSPVYAWYAWLFYTDVGSVFWVLACLAGTLARARRGPGDRASSTVQGIVCALVRVCSVCVLDIGGQGTGREHVKAVGRGIVQLCCAQHTTCGVATTRSTPRLRLHLRLLIPSPIEFLEEVIVPIPLGVYCCYPRRVAQL